MGTTGGMGREAGDDATLGAWCRETWPRLVRVVMPWCDEIGQAEDIAQEALARAVTRFDRSGEIGPVAWATAVALRYLADLSVEDTAQVMGCSPSTVKTHVRDAFATLRADPNLREHELIGETHGTG